MAYLEENENIFALALGELCITASASENHIRRFIHTLMANGDRKTSQIVTADMHFSNLCSLVASLYSYKEKRRDKAEKVKLLMRQFRDVYKQRDEFVHSEWIAIAPTRAKKFKRFISFDVDIADIRSLSERFKTLNSELTPFIYDWEKEHPSKEFVEFLNYLTKGLNIPSGTDSK